MNPVFASDLLSSNKQISVDNVPSLNLSLDTINELEITNKSSVVLTASAADVVGFQYKLTDDTSKCSDSSDYSLVSGSTVSLDYSSSSNGRQVICAVGVISSGFQKPYDNGASQFIWFLKTNPPKTPLHVKGFDEVSKTDQITASLSNPYLGAYRYKFDTVASGIDCSDSTSYTELTF